LSGGERNRLLLAKLFSQPSNLLVMDEPTNDLDVETLELLEELLADYRGTLLLVSHDRSFLDNVVTSTLVLEGEGRIGEYVGCVKGTWQIKSGAEPMAPTAASPDLIGPVPFTANKRKPSFKVQHEGDQLPGKIDALEAALAARTQAMNAPGYFQQEGQAIAKANQDLAAVQTELDRVYARWAELDKEHGMAN
jgi:ATP-binding cassette subfamily F protein uup